MNGNSSIRFAAHSSLRLYRAKAVMGGQVKTIRIKNVRHEYLAFKLSNNASALEIPCQKVPDVLLKDRDLNRRPPYLFIFACFMTFENYVTV